MTENFFSKVKLGSVLIFHNNRRVPLSSVERMKRKGNYPYYGAQGVIDYIDDFIFEGEYLLVAEDGANLESRTNPICLLTNSSEQFWVNNHAHILTTNDHADVRYIMYYINKMDLSPYITGSAQPKLSKTSLMSVEVFLPDITKQKLIASMLSSLDDKIEVNNKINSNLEELAQTLYKRWFVDFEFPNEEGKPYKSSGGEMVESEIGLVPKVWEVLHLDKLFSFERGVEPGSKNYSSVKLPGYVPFIRVGDLESKSNNYVSIDLIKDKTCMEEDVLVSFDGAVGRVAIGHEGAYSTGIRKIQSFVEDIDFSFIYLLFKSQFIQDQIQSYANGTTIMHAGSSIKHLIAPLNINLIAEFSLIIRPMIKQMLNNMKQNESLAHTRDLLLPKLMSGEIEV